MAHKTLVNGTAYDVRGGKTLVNGTVYSIAGGKAIIDGTAYGIAFGTPIGKMAVGTSVWLNILGTPTEFIIVQHGDPTAYGGYPGFEDGTWLLMKDVYIDQKWVASTYNSSYSASNIHDYLNNTLVKLLDSNIQSIMKEVRIPYCIGPGANGTGGYGENGLPAKMFVLSRVEVGAGQGSTLPAGAVLSYFYPSTNAKRIGYRDGAATAWWLRSVPKYNDVACAVNGNGSVNDSRAIGLATGVRPALILPSDTIL